MVLASPAMHADNSRMARARPAREKPGRNAIRVKLAHGYRDATDYKTKPRAPPVPGPPQLGNDRAHPARSEPALRGECARARVALADVAGPVDGDRRGGGTATAARAHPAPRARAMARPAFVPDGGHRRPA